MTTKPGIIVLSHPTDDWFEWMSDGWFCEEVRDEPLAQALMCLAVTIIDSSTTVVEATRRLEEAGFVITKGY